MTRVALNLCLEVSVIFLKRGSIGRDTFNKRIDHGVCLATQILVNMWRVSTKKGDSPFPVGLHTSFRFVSTLKTGSFCDLSVGIPLCFSIFEHAQCLCLFARAIEVLSFDLHVCHSVSHPPLLLLPRLFFFASTHLDRRGAACSYWYMQYAARFSLVKADLQLLLYAVSHEGG